METHMVTPRSAPMRPRAEKPADVGIIVGRFQVHELHEAHRDLIDTVVANHDRVIIFIGLSPLRNTAHNPLDFNSRKKMIQDTYPDIEVYYIDDNPSDVIWSKVLDREISKWITPNQTAIIYGSRDSFIQYYSGSFPVQELEATKFISGTELRRRIANTYKTSDAFRAGVISASMNRYPTCYTTVDVAIIDPAKNRILMGRKENEPHLRFIGGFASPTSTSFEEDARREVMEETGVEVDGLEYIGSTFINDWRYRNEIDKIKTIFYLGTYVHGRPQANDDIQSVEWVDMLDLKAGVVEVMPEHHVLVNMLINYYYAQ